MKQLLLHKGAIQIENVPSPGLSPQNILVEVSKSLISTGTESTSVQLSGASLIEKARRRPEQAMKVLESIKVRGIKRTYALVQGRLDESKPLGYSATGTVLAVGKNVTQFQVGDRVACAGQNIASHAEIISVPINLSAKVPSEVSDKSASFVTVGAIAMQGVRRADVRLGESVCVIGLGLIGQLTVQLLKSSGCRVLGMDVDAGRVEFAKKMGMDAGATSAEELNALVNQYTSGRGADVTIITASTESSEPTRHAFELTRKKGKVVLVGAVGMNLRRSPFYEKEQDFLISCSYGPGRYDADYEKNGQDYPYAYVRWTENRNMQSFLELIQDKKINVEGMIDEEFSFQDSSKAYDLLSDSKGDKPLAIVLDYKKSDSPEIKVRPVVKVRNHAPQEGKIKLGLIGAGNFAKTTHLPNLKQLNEKVEIVAVCTGQSATAATIGRQFKASQVTTDYHTLLDDSEVDALLVTTRHDKHAQIAKDALAKGKHVFMEKPLALTQAELDQLNETVGRLSSAPTFIIGFNRRYAPLVKEIQEAMSSRKNPLIVNYRVNAGELPIDHWTKTSEGGGRLRGEACHMVDLFQALTKSPLKQVSVHPIHPNMAEHIRPDENFSAQFSYEDGSVCNLIYTSLGHKLFPKEYMEVFWDGKSAVLNDFSKLTLYTRGKDILNGNQDKGHFNIMETFLNGIQNGISFPIPWDHLVETTQATIELDNEVWGRYSN